MSFTKANFDKNAYDELVNQSEGPGQYRMDMAQRKPSTITRAQYKSNTAGKVAPVGIAPGQLNLINLESSLMGLDKPLTKVTSKKHREPLTLPKDIEFMDEVLDFPETEHTRRRTPGTTVAGKTSRGNGWNHLTFSHKECPAPQEVGVYYEFEHGRFGHLSKLEAKDTYEPMVTEHQMKNNHTMSDMVSSKPIDIKPVKYSFTPAFTGPMNALMKKEDTCDIQAGQPCYNPALSDNYKSLMAHYSRMNNDLNLE